MPRSQGLLVQPTMIECLDQRIVLVLNASIEDTDETVIATAEEQAII
jgi:hypothetical protein